MVGTNYRRPARIRIPALAGVILVGRHPRNICDAVLGTRRTRGTDQGEPEQCRSASRHQTREPHPRGPVPTHRYHWARSRHRHSISPTGNQLQDHHRGDRRRTHREHLGVTAGGLGARCTIRSWFHGHRPQDIAHRFARLSPGCAAISSYDSPVDADTAGDEEALFTALDGPTQAELRARGRQQTYRPGSVLFYEGQLEAPVVIAVSGHLRVSAFSSDGRELILAFRGRGAILGELAALDRGRRSATVSAVDVVRA